MSAFLLGKSNILEGRLSEWGHLEPLKRNVKRWRRSRDGCAGQCDDKQKPANHGKDRADGAAQALNGIIKR